MRSSPTALPEAVADLHQEFSLYRKMLDAHPVPTGTQPEFPVLFVDEDTSRHANNLLEWMNAPRDSLSRVEREIARDRLEDVARRLQRSQRDFLFSVGDGRQAPPLRSQAEVLERILFYIMVYDAEADCPPESRFDAYSLFYYVTSLVPVEIQVRTALADTMAEQYHKIYKVGGDSSKSFLQQQRLKGVARELIDIDREMEVQYEDFISARSRRRRAQSKEGIDQYDYR
jgi:hypothetical protein